MRVLQQIKACSINDPTLFCKCDAFSCTAERYVFSLSYLNKNQGASVGADNVYFPALVAHVSGQNSYPVLLKVINGCIFGFVAGISCGTASFLPRLGRCARRAIFGREKTHWNCLSMKNEFPALYVVATPIGNLADITLRALQVLRMVNWIAAEDTRHTLQLLNHHGIEGRLLAAHQHNEQAAAERIVEKLDSGESVAMVSDAGTPGISDPGARVVARVREAGYRIIPIPGASALIAAVSAAGLADGEFMFLGFLPPKSTAKRRSLRKVAANRCSLVFYEAPHRVLETIQDCITVFGPARQIIVAKEVTKLFETFHVSELGEVTAWFEADSNRLKGEFVLIVKADSSLEIEGHHECERILSIMLNDGLSVKQAATLAAKITGVPRKTLYERALSISHEVNSA